MWWGLEKFSSLIIFEHIIFIRTKWQTMLFSPNEVTLLLGFSHLWTKWKFIIHMHVCDFINLSFCDRYVCVPLIMSLFLSKSKCFPNSFKFDTIIPQCKNSGRDNFFFFKIIFYGFYWPLWFLWDLANCF